MNRTIEAKVGIYDTVYRMICHKTGEVTVIVPYIKWVNNNGSLKFRRILVVNKVKAMRVKEFFKNQYLLGLHDFLEYNYGL